MRHVEALMRSRHLKVSFLAPVVAAMLALGGGAATAWAAAQQPVGVSAQALPATQITNKVILPETSIDGPALASLATSGTNESALAWTGTDAAHHLNVAKFV